MALKDYDANVLLDRQRRYILPPSSRKR